MSTFRRSIAIASPKNISQSQTIGVTMQIRVLAASSSLSRRLWYRNELGRHGFETETADSGIACVQRAVAFQPDVMILEPLLTWGGSDGVLDVRQRDPRLRSVPVIVVDLRHDAAETYRIGAYELAGYWKWVPTSDELARAIVAAAGSNHPLRPVNQTAAERVAL